MAKRTTATNTRSAAGTTPENVEPLIVAMAEQLGTLLGRARGTAEGWLESAAVRQQVSQIRDAATQLLERMNQAGTTAGSSAASALLGNKVKKAKKSAAARKTNGRNRGIPDAPSRRLRKPPPEELFDKRLGEPMGQQMGQKNLRRRGRG